MADIDEWREYVKEHNGGLVVWIDQSTDSKLLAVNSRGVCFALTDAWVRAFTSYKIDRAGFVNSFRGSADPTTRIPAQYLDEQAEYSRKFQTMKTNFQATLDDLQERVRRKEQVDLKGFQESFLAARQTFYGKSCEAFQVYNRLVPIISANQDMFALTQPRYHMLSMSGKISHVVGFEMRPDLVSSVLPNGLYEFFDANLGLFFFRTLKDLQEFWEYKVCIFLYNDFPKSVDLATFGIGRGGFAKTWGELLAEVQQWIMNLIKSLWGSEALTA